MQSSIEYLHAKPSAKLPNRHPGGPFRCVVIVEAEISPDGRLALSEWLVDSGCLYMMAWGPECSRWDDDVDDASLARFDYGDVPEDKRVMTTWHDGEALNEVFRFAKEFANHPTVEISKTLLLHISQSTAEAEMLAAFENAKD